MKEEVLDNMEVPLRKIPGFSRILQRIVFADLAVREKWRASKGDPYYSET